VTGHEKGSIVVWHNIVTYYLTALSNATTTTIAPATTTVTTTASKSEKKKELKQAKQAANAESTVAMPISTTLHWHAHSGMFIVLCCVVCAYVCVIFLQCVCVVGGGLHSCAFLDFILAWSRI